MTKSLVRLSIYLFPALFCSAVAVGYLNLPVYWKKTKLIKIEVRKNTDGRSEQGEIWDTAMQKQVHTKLLKLSSIEYEWEKQKQTGMQSLFHNLQFMSKKLLRKGRKRKLFFGT